MQIRDFEAGDAERVKEILALTSRFHDVETESSEFFMAASKDPTTELLVAVDGEVVGVCRGTHTTKAMILQLYVHPDGQGHGIGTALVREICSRFQERGAERVYATVDDRCRPYWKRIGFAEASNRLVFRDLPF